MVQHSGDVRTGKLQQSSLCGHHSLEDIRKTVDTRCGTLVNPELFGLKQETGNSRPPLGYVTTKAVRAKVKDTGKKTALHSCILSEAPTVPHGTGPPAACLWALTVIEGAITPLGMGRGGLELGSQCQLEPSGTSVAQRPSGNMYVTVASHPRNRLLLNIKNTFIISRRCWTFLTSEPIRKYFCPRKMYVNSQDKPDGELRVSTS